MQDGFGSKRGSGGERHAIAERAQIPKRGCVEPHGERLIEDRQKIRVVIDSVFERTVWKKKLNEKSLVAALSIGAAAHVASAHFKAPSFAVSPHG